MGNCTVHNCALRAKVRPLSRHPYPIPSIASIAVSMSISGPPPYSGGTERPRIPNSAHFCQFSRENVLFRSRSTRHSFSSCWANLTTLSRNASCSSDQEKSIDKVWTQGKGQGNGKGQGTVSILTGAD